MSTQTITPNFHVLVVKNLMATNSTGSRVKITSDRFNQSVVIPYSNEAGSGTPALDTAELWLKSKGHNVVGHGEGKNHYYVICDAVNNCFSPLK
jgi:hypothetical protein